MTNLTNLWEQELAFILVVLYGPGIVKLKIRIGKGSLRWFGTDKGVARHRGYKTLEDWTVFNKENGLIDEFVQTIAYDKKGNLWFGTKAGVSVFNGSNWKSFTAKDGLCSDNILSIVTDANGTVWLGTDNGVMSYRNEEITIYK